MCSRNCFITSARFLSYTLQMHQDTFLITWSIEQTMVHCSMSYNLAINYTSYHLCLPSSLFHLLVLLSMCWWMLQLLGPSHLLESFIKFTQNHQLRWIHNLNNNSRFTHLELLSYQDPHHHQNHSLILGNSLLCHWHQCSSPFWLPTIQITFSIPNHSKTTKKSSFGRVAILQILIKI